MITSSDVKWGRYKTWEGPVFWGSIPYVSPKDPSDSDKLLKVLTMTEGAKYDAVNMYDSMIISVGIIQWAERSQYCVSDMLGKVAEALGEQYVLDCLAPALKASNATFHKNAKGKWRFFFIDSRGEVDTDVKQRELFLKSSGEVGEWSEAAKAHAKIWAASVANVWWDERAQAVQRKFCVDRMMWFLLPTSKTELFASNIPNTSWHGAIKAGYLSFAGNLPAIADKVLKAHLAQTKHEKFSKNWCIELLKRLTFDPAIAIFLVRYNNIRPALEELYGVELPKTAKDLQVWVPEKVESKQVITQETKIETVHDEPIHVEKNVEIVPSKPTDVSIVSVSTTNSAKLSLIDKLLSMFKMILGIFSRKS